MIEHWPLYTTVKVASLMSYSLCMYNLSELVAQKSYDFTWGGGGGGAWGQVTL